MAKVKKKTPIKILKPPTIWLENKIAAARRFSEHRASRAARRFGAPAGVALLLLITLYSLFLPKTRFELAKERVLQNPNDFEAHLILAEEFLQNNQLEKAEKELIIAQSLTINHEPSVLGASSKLEELYLRWQEEKPEELEKLIEKWEKIVSETPTYRDGYLHLALYYFKLGDQEKAQENLTKALELEPNYEETKELEKIISR